MSLAQLSDDRLVEASLRGSRDAFEVVVERHQNLVCSIAYAITGDLALSEDIAQETFLTAWRHLADLKEPQKLRQWLCGIARNLAMRLAHRRRREVSNGIDPWREMFGDEHGAADPGAVDPLERMISAEEANVLWRALADLPPAYREPLVLYYRENLSLEKMSEALGLSQDLAKLRLSRGRRMLKDQLATHVEEALISTRPSRAFTAAVAAALPALIPQAMASAATTAVAKCSTAGKALAAAGLAGLMFGPILGLLGIFIGSHAGRVEWESRKQRADRLRLAWICFWSLMITVVITAVGIVAVMHRAADTPWDPLGIIAAAAGAFSLTLVAILAWGNRRLNRSGPAPLFTRPSRKEIRRSLAGGVFGSICWSIPLSAGAGDFAAAITILLVAGMIWWAASRLAMRAPARFLKYALLAMCAVAACNVLAVHLRWDRWMSVIRGSEWHVYGDTWPLWLANCFVSVLVAGAFLHLLRLGSRRGVAQIPR